MKAFQGQGGYGAVYRAERRGFGRSEPGALKASLSLWNWRMEREVELLSRLSHPGIPRLLDRGGKLSPSRDEYPFFVMEWVEGTPLYAWAEQHSPSSPQVCRVLARLARALEAGAGGVESPAASRSPVQTRTWKPWLTLAATGACAVWLLSSQWVSRPFSAQAPDSGTVAVGDTSPTEPQASTASQEENKPIAQEPPPQPRPEQARPDEKGRCPGNKQVLINGGCWIDVSASMSAGECVGNAGLLFKGKCYLPAPAPPRKPAPTSNPGEAR